MDATELRRSCANEELDYVFLKGALARYANPRDKITRFLKSKVLLRVKKGLYVFGPAHAQKPFSKEMLANLIYGPSAVSLQHALSFYGLIPERTETVTSITSKRNKDFRTPVGTFTYRYLNPKLYPVGIALTRLDEGRSVLMATREKALCDVLAFASPALRFKNEKELEEYLIEGLRIDQTELKKLRKSRIKKLAEAYADPNVTWLFRLLSTARGKK